MVPTVKYEVVRKLGEVEIRRYPKIVIAKASNSESDNFGLLFQFISGNNVQKEKVKMTTPVVSQNQEIKMTTLVLSDFSNQGYMAFAMPPEFSIETTPLPLDSRVKVEEVPSRLVAVLRFSGGWSQAHFEEKQRSCFKNWRMLK